MTTLRLERLTRPVLTPDVCTECLAHQEKVAVGAAHEAMRAIMNNLLADGGMGFPWMSNGYLAAVVPEGD